jgi:KaiC/GvpD/RAD55 family RecA-like ATPase
MSEGAAGAYDLGEAFPVDDARHLPPGTSLLVIGTPGVGTETLALESLAAGHERGEGVVPVSTARAAADLRDRYTAATGRAADGLVSVVDASGGGDGIESPGDLTGIGGGLSRATESVGTPRLRVGVLSLTSMLEFLDRRSVFKFCHTVCARVDNAGYLGLATLDTTAVDEQTVGMLSEAFDGTVELREDEKGEVARVVGLPDTAVTWHARG